MFKFDFKVDTAGTYSAFSSDTEKEATSHAVGATEQLQWYESEEIRPDAETLHNLELWKLNSTDLSAGEVTLHYVVAGFLLNDLASDKEGTTKDISKAEENHTDLIPGVYEGGAKIWECTNDLLEYLSANYTNAMIQGKRVLDLGCGSGLLGIFAYKCGAKVHFQDYNKDVLQTITVPNLLLNVPKPPLETDLNLSNLHEDVRFYSGDWSKFTEATRDDDQFDIILTSETIYNSNNQKKLLDTFYAKLKPTGIVLVAAKTYYFGVGGGLRQFEQLIRDDKRFRAHVLWTATEGVGREILKLTFL